MLHRSFHLPGNTGGEATFAFGLRGLRSQDFDLSDAGDGAALFLHDEALSNLEIEIGQQVALRAAGQRVVNIRFAVIIKGAIDIAQERFRNGLARFFARGDSHHRWQRRRAGIVPFENRFGRGKDEARALVVSKGSISTPHG